MAIAAICILCTRNLHIGTMRKQYAYCASNIYIECAVWLLRQYAYCAHSLDIGIMSKQYAYCTSNMHIECAVRLLHGNMHIAYAQAVCILAYYCTSNIHIECTVWLLHSNLHIAYAQFRYRDNAQAIYLLCCEQQAICKPCGVVTNNSNCVYEGYSRTCCIDSWT